MKTIRKFTAATSIFFILFFVVSTLFYREVYPSIISVKVVRYGFPMTWLETRTVVLPPSPTQYTVLWFELLIDVTFYFLLSSGSSFITLKATRRREKPGESSLWGRLLLILLVAYITKLLSCGIHELLGHGLWAWIFGADRIRVHVSWLGFGWCNWQGMSESSIARFMAMAGGLIDTFMIGAAILAFLFLARRRGGFYPRFFLFWLGFWATTGQAGYMLLGGFTGRGDPGSLHSLTGIPLSLFMLLGFASFLLVYPVISLLFLSEVSGLLPEYSRRTLLFEFWLAIPVQAILVMVSNPLGIKMTFEMSLLLLLLSMTPSLLSLPLVKFLGRSSVLSPN